MAEKQITREQLAKRVDDIIRTGGDSEMAHGEEDDLHFELIQEFCPEWVKKEIARLSEANFPRWCA